MPGRKKNKIPTRPYGRRVTEEERKKLDKYLDWERQGDRKFINDKKD